jgi:hypothetical protein
MLSNYTYSGVGVAGMRTLRVAGAPAAAAHPAFMAHAAWAAAAINPQRKRRAATAIVASVNRGTT